MKDILTINATLFVQVINFWIAYVLIKHLLVLPVYRVICADDADDQQAHQAVERGKNRVEHHENEIQNLWKTCRTYFAQQAPEPIRPEQASVETPRDADSSDEMDVIDMVAVEEQAYDTLARGIERKVHRS